MVDKNSNLYKIGSQRALAVGVFTSVFAKLDNELAKAELAAKKKSKKESK